MDIHDFPAYGAPADIRIFGRNNEFDYIKRVKALIGDGDKSYYIDTYGCQMNAHDSESLAGILEIMGYAPAQAREEADIIVFNTCCVRENAENRIKGNIGAVKPLKEKRPDLITVVCGCMTQQPGVAESLKKTFSFIDIVMGSGCVHKLPELLLEVLSGRRTAPLLSGPNEAITEHTPVKRVRKESAYINIMYGCNNFCSYCIVPYVRGRERSRRSEDILEEARALAGDGCLEIVLLGQNVNSYGKDSGEISFAQLLRRLDKIDGIKRISFMTSHPKDLSEELIDAMAQCEHVSNQLHLPVQSGSDRILRLMNRKYTRAHYMDLVRSIRKSIPDIGLSTDLIVGFPGETDEDFEDTLSLCREIGFASAFTFIYSKRSGTPAASMPEQVPLKIKRERIMKLIEVVEEEALRVSQNYLGKEYEVLVESLSRRSGSMLSGRTSCGRTVTFKGEPSLIGSFANVKITQIKKNTLAGELINN
ncbi:MAG TPA: tRNA (N6-isopentenyl adenosine(37)-C2)-methylthiotransferase MiaB [Firmicutes bacterium]|nr:tRNA (N6-isopentenyl adenosine(37)-C2)-methylthiotransferase MiaB [Bacillota bacterium]